MQNKRHTPLRLAGILTGAIAALAASGFAEIDDHHVDAQPVTDINTEGDSNPSSIVFAEDKLYFIAADKKGRSSLYVKTLVKGSHKDNDPKLDRAPVKLKSLFTTDRHGTVTNLTADNFVVSYNRVKQKQTLFFHVPGQGLYVTNGSAAGTIRLLKWNADDATFGYIDPSVTAYQGDDVKKKAGVVFTGFSNKTGFEPFITDGTPSGTRCFADLISGAGSSFPSGYCARPSGIFQDQIFFTAFDPFDFYQLHRYSENEDEKTFTVDHFNVARTDDQDANLATFPRNLTLAGNDVVFSAGNNANNTNRDVGIVDTVGASAFFLTTDGSDPTDFGASTSLSSALFAATDDDLTSGAFGTRRLWVAYGQGGSSFAEIQDDVVVGTAPHNIHTFASNTFLLATEADGDHLYQRSGRYDSTRITDENGNALIVSEYIGAYDSTNPTVTDGDIYMVGHRTGELDQLWIYPFSNTGSVDGKATPVLTYGPGDTQGTPTVPILNPSHLAPAVHLAGSTFLDRVYFSCSGVGSKYEFILDKHGNPTGQARGEELWVYQPAL